MSVRVTSWAWDQSITNLPAKLVLLKLADQANDEGICWPSRRTIAGHTGLSISTVKRAVHYLIEGGYITREKRTWENGKQSSNAYHFPSFTVGGQPEPPGGQAEPHGGHSYDPEGGSAVDRIEPLLEPASEPVRFPTLDEEAELKAENARLLAALRKDLRL